MSRRLELRPVGDSAVLAELDGNADVHSLTHYVRTSFGDAFADVVPGHTTVLLRWRTPDPPHLILDSLRLGGWSPAPMTRAEPVTIQVRYDGPDLEEIAARSGLGSIPEVIARHTAPTYSVAFTGFTAGFAYLVDGDPRLGVPRRATPRESVPAGAVAVAGPYTAIYPRRSPGGWHILGTTDALLFDPERDPPALLTPAVQVRLEPLDP